MDIGTLASRCLLILDYALAPQGEYIRQGFQPCASSLVEEVTLFFRHRRT